MAVCTHLTDRHVEDLVEIILKVKESYVELTRIMVEAHLAMLPNGIIYFYNNECMIFTRVL